MACADDRAIQDGHCERPVGNTVDIDEASYTNTIGDALLGAYWVDPDFDPRQKAFYYVRVLEIPTPRWTAYDVKFFGVADPDGTVMELQDRAYTRPHLVCATDVDGCISPTAWCQPGASAIQCWSSRPGHFEDRRGLQPPPLGTVIIVTHTDGREHTNTSRKVSPRRASPACIAGVRVSRPNFRAR